MFPLLASGRRAPGLLPWWDDFLRSWLVTSDGLLLTHWRSLMLPQFGLFIHAGLPEGHGRHQRRSERNRDRDETSWWTGPVLAIVGREAFKLSTSALRMASRVSASLKARPRSSRPTYLAFASHIFKCGLKRVHRLSPSLPEDIPLIQIGRRASLLQRS